MIAPRFPVYSLIALVVSLAACTPAAAAAAAPAVQSATVARVADGDTVTLTDGRKIRILGIDAPESVKPNAPVECFGPESSAFAKAALLGKTVTVIPDPTQDASDRFGRHLAYLELDGLDYSTLAAEAGVAYSYVYDKPVQRHPEIVAAERRAQKAGRGLWGSCR
jgi:micrococcal nuclease